LQIIPYLRLIRPLNAAMTAAAVCAAAFISAPAGDVEWIQVILGALAAGLIAAGGNVHNDVLDMEVDRINRPDRPLPRGLVSKKEASNFAVILFAGGILIGYALGLVPSVITLAAALTLMVYNHKLKMTPLAGNIAVSLLTGLAFVFGGVLTGNVKGALIPAGFSLFFHFSREMVKDIQDCEGDKVRSGATFAQKYGSRTAALTAADSMGILLIMVPLPYFAHLYDFKYLMVSSLGVELPLLWAIYTIMKREVSNLGTISKILKIGMVMGLISLIAGRGCGPFCRASGLYWRRLRRGDGNCWRKWGLPLK